MHRKLEPTRTYANVTNMEAAVARAGLSEQRYFVAYTEDGRCFPLFTFEQPATAGNPQGFNAVVLGIHGLFNVIG